MRDDGENSLMGNIFDGIIIFFIIASIVQVIAETFPLSASAKTVCSIFEIVSVAIFTIEYLLRVWTSSLMYPDKGPVRSRLRYIFSFMALIDLVSILPFYVPYVIPIDLRVLRTLRILRLFRLFKINRYVTAMSTILSVLKRKLSQLVSSILVVGLLMIISAVLMYNIENAAQPDVFSNAFDALWWSVATFTTVGYGDIFPVTVAGKILSAIIAVLGIGLVAVPTGIISSGFTESVASDHRSDPDDMSYCPHCGKKLK